MKAIHFNIYAHMLDSVNNDTYNNQQKCQRMNCVKDQMDKGQNTI